MRSDLSDYAESLRQSLSAVEGVAGVEATFRRSGPIHGAQSVVSIHTPSTDPPTVMGILAAALERCAHILAPAPIRGSLFLYCFDGDGMRHTLDELDPDLGVAISFDRLADREGLERP